MKPPIAHFDAIARFYDRLIRPPVGDKLGEILEIGADEWLLDLGGGTGRRAKALKEVGIEVIVCDRSLPMLEEARKKGLDVVLASADRLPFANGSVPRVMVIDAFHHFVLPDPPTAQAGVAQEIGRVLRHGGRALIEEPDVRNLAGRLILWMEWLLMMGSRFLSPETLAESLRSQGTRVEIIASAGMSYRLLVTNVERDRELPPEVDQQ